MALFDLIGRRWILRVVWELHRAERALTFRELRAHCSDMSASVLTTRLAELQDARLVERTSTGYALTDLGSDLVASMQPLSRWSARWAESFSE
jgi:DNA-binding HxlR family transcriptional regulator